MSRYIASQSVKPVGSGNSFQQVFYERDDTIVESVEQLWNRPGDPIGANLTALAAQYYQAWMDEMAASGNPQTDNGNSVTVADAWLDDTNHIVTVPPGQ